MDITYIFMKSSVFNYAYVSITCIPEEENTYQIRFRRYAEPFRRQNNHKRSIPLT